tara:strand:+ start:137 stop:343 length:207 start_codon:yes stop_codon:yes gene_type:complete
VLIYLKNSKLSFHENVVPKIFFLKSDDSYIYSVTLQRILEEEFELIATSRAALDASPNLKMNFYGMKF